jgi:probable DNA repair protein
MGAWAAMEMDAWLRQGGLVVTASERAARALGLVYNRARRAEGLTAWNAPRIQDWNSFVRAEWTARSVDGRLLLNPAQERALWAGIAASDDRLATLLEGPRYRLAGLAMDAHGLLASHAPRYLRKAERSGWQNDAADFSRWLDEFDERCRAGNLLSPARLPLELLALLDNQTQNGAGRELPALLLAGFDRTLPVQRAVFSAWGACREAETGSAAEQVQFHEAADEQSELAACAQWCHARFVDDPEARILVVSQDAAQRRGEMERAFLRALGAPEFEFSLGVPLSRVGWAGAAYLLLRWLTNPVAEHELDWLFGTGYASAAVEEQAALEARMRTLRRRGLERPEWTLDAFLGPAAFLGRDAFLGPGAFSAPFAGRAQERSLPTAWVVRVRAASGRLEAARSLQSPLEWAELVPELLETLRFGEGSSLGSAEFQAARRWQQALETAGSLGIDGRRMDWPEFLSTLRRTLDETLFAPESREAPIQIAGPAESAGLAANAVWFLGASETAWPATGATHPLLPPEVQREAEMPHASPQLDWELAQAMTTRLLASAAEVHFSYARQVKGAEARPSRLITQIAGTPVALRNDLQADAGLRTILVEDFSRIERPPGKVQGGAGVLTAQSQCPFQAFATARLGAKGWEPAQAGLTHAQRGQLLHAVMHAVWGGGEHGIRTQAKLPALADREAWVRGHVERACAEALPAGGRARMPAGYLELEQRRLTRLVSAWLEYETARVPFEVIETEGKRTVVLEGLEFDLRLDRLDRLSDGSVLVIDYKTGDVKPKMWEPPRPEDVQLPLYAGFALDADQELGGLVFARLRAGELSFAGRVGDAVNTLLPDLGRSSALVKQPFTAEMLLAWKDSIEDLARDFRTGRAGVDPRDYPKTCERCGLQSLCRIQESAAALGGEDEADEEEADA